MEKSYRKVEVTKYVKELLESGIKPFEAEKAGKIFARRGTVGEEVISWSEDEYGNPIIEKRATVTLDKETGKPGFVVTKVDEKGEPVIDKNGHTNTWIIDDSVFARKYILDETMGKSIYKSNSGIQLFIEIQENIEMEQWGKAETIARGGVINITNPDDMYGISSRDFTDTYVVIPSTDTKTKKLLNK